MFQLDNKLEEEKSAQAKHQSKRRVVTAAPSRGKLSSVDFWGGTLDLGLGLILAYIDIVNNL